MKVLLSILAVVTATAAIAVRIPSVTQDLKAIISTASSVSIGLQARWSDFNAPLPAVVVNGSTEKDVAAIIRYCTNASIPFLAQNGGVGWAKTFNLGQSGVLINLAGLNAVTISKDKKQATIGGGAGIGDTIAAADTADDLVLTGNCNCVGSVSAYLGGGYGNLMGEVGFGVDNIISLRVATASGNIATVSRTSYPDLFWAFRSAGPNFGIVISATVNAQPATSTDHSAFINNLFFTPFKLPQIVQAIEDLPLTPLQRVYLVYPKASYF